MSELYNGVKMSKLFDQMAKMQEDTMKSLEPKREVRIWLKDILIYTAEVETEKGNWENVEDKIKKETWGDLEVTVGKEE